MNLLPYIVTLSVVCIWGSTFVSSKVLLTNGLTPADIFFYRFLMAYVCLAMMNRKRWRSDSMTDELTMMGLGVMGGSLYFLTENYALVFSTTSNASILVSSTPLLTALVVGACYRSERLNRRQVLYSLLAFVGMAMIVMNGQLILHLSPLGDFLAIMAALTWAFYSLLMKKVAGRYSSLFITRKVFFYGLITILPYFLFYNPLQMDMELFAMPKISLNLLFLGLIASIGCYLAWNWVLSRISIVKATTFLYMQCLVTMITSRIILSERITWMALLGTVVLILGMAGVQKAKVQGKA